MKKNELQRMVKIEDRIKEIVMGEMGLKCNPVEFDIVPDLKMIEIMAYRSSVQIGNWKWGRDYERLRTIHENDHSNLPFEVVIHSNPDRAYLMESNPIAVQVLVMAHVYGHVNFSTENKWFQKGRDDILLYLASAVERINGYEKKYGIDEVERIIDAGHALQFHSSPHDNETEHEKRERIFKQQKQKFIQSTSEYSDLTKSDLQNMDMKESIELHNSKLWRSLKLKSPVEPTEDILRYIIDNSQYLEDWQRDILEVLRTEGQFFWPVMNTTFLNEGWATQTHSKVTKQLADEGLLSQSEYGTINYYNSLVKADNPHSMNPYLIGSKMWEDIEQRWNTGRHGYEYENCIDSVEKKNWDIKENKGFEKCKEIMRTYTDWFFMQNYLTNDMVDKLNLYVYVEQDSYEMQNATDLIRTSHDADQVRQFIVNGFAYNGTPKIKIIDGKYNGSILRLEHTHNGNDLDETFTKKTLEHIFNIWGTEARLDTESDGKKIFFVVKGKRK